MPIKPAIPATELDSIKHMYYVQKMHMAQIAAHYKLSIDAVVSFMRRYKLKRRSLSESNQINFDRKPLSYQKKISITEKDKILEVSGTMLYWAEGSKSDKYACVDFANSDPKMIALFLEYLRKIFSVDEKRLRISPYFYSDQNTMELTEFWSKITQVPLSQFHKPYIRYDFKTDAKKMEYGLVHVRYADKKLLLEIKSMIDSYSMKYAPVG